MLERKRTVTPEYAPRKRRETVLLLGTVCSIVIISALWSMSLQRWHRAGVTLSPHWTLEGVSNRGVMSFCLIHYAAGQRRGAFVDSGYGPAPMSVLLGDARFAWRIESLTASIAAARGWSISWLAFPHWFVALLIGLGGGFFPGFRIVRRRWRRRAGCCWNCGYCLRGILVQRCPECGCAATNPEVRPGPGDVKGKAL